jgi:large subunit ribosomal protein L30
MAKELGITLVHSGIGRPQRQKRTLVGLGLTKLHKTVRREDTPAIRGMVAKVSHLVKVEEIDNN